MRHCVRGVRGVRTRASGTRGLPGRLPPTPQPRPHLVELEVYCIRPGIPTTDRACLLLLFCIYRIPSTVLSIAGSTKPFPVMSV